MEWTDNGVFCSRCGCFNGFSRVGSMPWTEGAKELSAFQSGHIVGQCEQDASQREVVQVLQISLFIINQMVVEWKTHTHTKTLSPSSGQPGPTEWQLRAAKQSVERDPRRTAASFTKTFDRVL